MLRSCPSYGFFTLPATAGPVRGIARRMLPILIFLSWLLPASAMAQRALSQGEFLYLPIYSFIWYGDRGSSGNAKQAPVSALVSIHNTDMSKTLNLLSANFFSTEGKLLRNFVPKPRLLKPMETVEILVQRNDTSGGSGANFVFQWESTSGPMSPPLVQALHAEMQTNRAIAFTTDAVVIAR